VGHVARIVEIRNIYNILVGKPERKRRFGKPVRRWEDIRMDLGVEVCKVWTCELDASGSG